MKNTVWAVIVLILAALFVLEFRYVIVVNSPIVAKINRITGDVWVANSGMWLKVKHPVVEQCAIDCSLDTIRAKKPIAKAPEEKAK